MDRIKIDQIFLSTFNTYKNDITGTTGSTPSVHIWGTSRGRLAYGSIIMIQKYDELCEELEEMGSEYPYHLELIAICAQSPATHVGLQDSHEYLTVSAKSSISHNYASTIYGRILRDESSIITVGTEGRIDGASKLVEAFWSGYLRTMMTHLNRNSAIQ